LDSYSDWNELDRFGNPIMYFAGMGSLFNEAKSFGPNATFTSENFIRAEEYFNQALEIHPYHVVTLYQLANLHRYRNDHESAKGVYERLLAISPRHPGGQLHYAVTLNALGDYEGAARVLVSAFLEKSYYESPDYQRAVVEALRKMPNQVKHEGLKPFLISRNQLSDEQLFQAFQLAKEKRLEEAQKH
jgi:tetratricopeptide (TPR) repeat protein